MSYPKFKAPKESNLGFSNRGDNPEFEEMKNDQILEFLPETELNQHKIVNQQEKKKILIVEDSVKLRNILVQILSENYYVTGLNDATIALGKYGELNPDIILLDIMLPGSIDGLSFLRIIKQDHQFKHIPVILMSLLSSDDIILEGLKLGANDYIVKPFDLRQLDLKIKNYINLNNEVRGKAILEQTIHFDTDNDTQDVLKKFELLLEENIMKDSEMTIEKYAQALNMSMRTFERLINKNYKMSPAKYIMQRKLKKADILIHSNNSMSIKEIALTLGFSSLPYFCRCYKLYFGKTPSS
jgi:DNA-binding response OmpR family regulator